MSGEEKEYHIKVRRIEGYRFEVDFGLGNTAKLMVDEDPPLGSNEGPDPSRLLAASMVHCTLSSLLFCMEKSKTKVNRLDASAKIIFGRDENKRLRIVGVDMTTNVSVPKADIAKLERCKSIFQDYCTVTQSVKRGIAVSSEIKLMEDDDGVGGGN